MAGTELFGSLSMNKYYKYLLYLGSVTLVLSIFLDVKGVNLTIVRHASLITAFTGLSLWILDYFMEAIANGTSKDWQREWGSILIVFYYVIIVIILLWGYTNLGFRII